MKTLQWTTVDKSKWARGEWDDEPDKMQYADELTGLPCLIVRNGSGALCGYVGVPVGHPSYEKDCRDVDADVHGGLTFADKCHPHGNDEGNGICHIPDDGEPDHVWWLGFDCAHAWDYAPAYSARPERFFRIGSVETYKTIAYVQDQNRLLAKQLAELRP